MTAQCMAYRNSAFNRLLHLPNSSYNNNNNNEKKAVVLSRNDGRYQTEEKIVRERRQYALCSSCINGRETNSEVEEVGTMLNKIKVIMHIVHLVAYFVCLQIQAYKHSRRLFTHFSSFLPMQNNFRIISILFELGLIFKVLAFSSAISLNI